MSAIGGIEITTGTGIEIAKIGRRTTDTHRAVLKTPCRIVMDLPQKADSDLRYRLEYGISRLIRYNGKRQRFFDGLHRLVLFVNSVLGSSAFVTIVSGQPYIAAWLTAVVAIMSSLDNVIGFSERARKFSEQRNRYYDLYCELLDTDRNSYREDSFKAKRLRIDGDSPPTRRVLDVVSRNEEDIFRGYSFDDTIYISRFRYLMRHIVDLPPKRWMTNLEWRQRPRWWRRPVKSPVEE